MIAPDPIKRPTASQLTLHPTVCPITEKSKVCILFCLYVDCYMLYSWKFLSVKNFKNQLHLCILIIIQKTVSFKYLCQCIKRHCIKDLIFFGILIFKRVVGFSKVSKISYTVYCIRQNIRGGKLVWFFTQP